METKRLFLGTFVDNSLFTPVLNNIVEDFSEVCTGKWTETENLHFTYKFLGNVEESKVDEIYNLLKPILRDFKSVLNFSGMGCFPHKDKPRVLYVKIFNNEKNIFKSFNKIERDMERLGFPKERKKFIPHVALLRVKSYNENFKEVFDKYKDIKIGLMDSFKIHLIESTLTNVGPIYKILK